MKIIEILMKNIPFQTGEPSVTCWVKTDVPFTGGQSEFACGLPWPEGGNTPSEMANGLRWMADCIETMSVRPRPNLRLIVSEGFDPSPGAVNRVD